MESSGKPPRAEDRKHRDEAAGATKPKAQSEGEKPQITLHQRRFDSKKGEIPENLTVSPHKDDSGSADNSPIPKSRASPDDVEWIGPEDGELDPAPDLSMLCEKMIKRLEGRDDVLSKRSRAVAFATKSTEDALDHLEKLYRLMDQLFALKEHNAQVLRRARDLEHLKNLQEIHRQIEKEMERAKLEDRELLIHNEAMNTDLEAEYGYTEALLDSMLAAGRSASVKRAGSRWKSPTQSKFRQSILRKQRSRSMGGEELESCPLSDKERLSVPQTLKSRRSSDLKVDKSKISKWTKVKAAFRWEKAHTGVAASGLVIMGPDEETPATPGSPLSLTPTSSLEELRGDNGVVRRGDVAPGGPYLQPPTPDETSASPSPNKLHKTPWGKMKDIIQTRKESVKKKQNRNSAKSFTDSQRLSEAYSQSDGGIGGLSNSESVEILSPSTPRTPFEAGNQHLDVSHFQSLTDDGSRKPPMLTVTMPSSEELARFVSSTQKNKDTDVNLPKSKSQSAVQPMDNKHQVLRKQRSLEFSHGGRPPVGRSRHDSGGEMSGSSPAATRRSSKWSKVKRAFLTSTSASVPSSPNRHSAFFTDIECDAGSSGGEAGGVREEIARDYAALQARLRRELQRRAAAAEWQRGKMYSASRPVATEEQLSADFRKKLVAWQRMKAAPASARQPPPIPDRSDLSEDFLKKWDEWKRLKETGSVPAWSEEPAPAARRPQHEVLVQTSTGFFRFHGISRSFTRKLHEWEKARGIAPEASTSALLRAARGALPRAQSAGSVAAACELAGGAHHASSLSVNDVERLERDLAQGEEQELPTRTDGGSDSEGPGAVLVEVEAEEVETAAPLVAVNPRHQRQTPVYKYDDSEPRHLVCETSECTPARSIPDAGLREAALAQLSEEVAYQQLFKGLRNINERFADVSKQISEVKNSQTNKSYGQVTGRLKELEKRLARLAKEGDILKNSLKDRANEFHTLGNKFKDKISSFMTNDSVSDMAKRKKIVDLLVDLNEKVEFIVQKASERLKHAVQGDFSNTDCTEDLKEVLRKIEQIEAARKKSFDENNLCVSYAMQRAQYVQAESSWNEDNTDYSSDLLNALPPNYVEPENVTSNKLKDIPELNVRSDVKDFFKPITRSTDSLNHRKEDSIDSKGAKKKDSLDKANSKKKLKSRQRIERQLSKNSESDTETDINTVTIEIPRRKKLIRTRRSSDTFGITKQRSLEKATDSDSEENVFVLKLKSPRRSESNFKDDCLCEVSKSVSQKVLQMPDEYITNEIVLKLPEKKSSSEKRLDQDFAVNFQPEEFEIQAEEERPSTPEIIVKTTRKIFSPVRRDSKGKPKAVIGFDLEEITSSIEKRRAENANKIENQLPDIVGSKQSIVLKDNKDNNSNPKQETKKSSESLNKKDFASKSPQDTSGYSVRKSSSTSDSLSYARGFTPSPLQGRKLYKFRDERNINNSQELFGSSSITSIKESSPVVDSESPNLRRSSGDRLGYNGKFSRRSPSLAGSPVLSRSNTPAASNSLPPLPSSPTTSRRDRPPVKETAPSIRIMIQKYNTKLNEEGAGRTSPVASSGSASPAWRSPGVDRRRPAQYPSDVRRVLQQGSVRNNPFFDREVQKSASASQIMKRQQSSPGARLKFSEAPTTDQDVTKSKDNISDASAELTPTSQKRLLKGILKSSSVGSLKTNSPSITRRLFNNRIDANHEENEDNIHNESVQKAIAENIDKHMFSKQDSTEADKSKEQRSSESPQTSLTNVDDRKSRIKSLASGLKRKLSGESPKLPKSAPNTPLGYKGDSPLRDLHRDSIERAIRLQRAKEQFLKSEPGSSKSTKDYSNSVHDLRSSNRLSQISCGSDTSFEANSLIGTSPNPKSYSTDPSLIKSLSVGMINVDRITYDHVSKDRGCVSLPRDHTKDLNNKPSKFSLSNIASKFRKVRMRKSKSNAKIAEKDKGKDLNTVSKLCRQSLLINIKPDSSNRTDSSEAIAGPSRIIGSQTNLSIVSAGRTGSVIAVGDVENIFPPVSRHDRSMSIPSDATNEKPRKEIWKVSKV